MDPIGFLAFSGMWMGDFLFGWGVHGTILTKRHVKDLREIKQQLIKLRGVE